MDLGLQQRVVALLEEADISVGGQREQDITVHDPHFHARVLAHGSLGLGESYMDGCWDAVRLDAFLFQLMQARIDERVHGMGELVDALKARLFNLQAGKGSYEVGRRHYDLGNDLYQAMLGRWMVYSCGYWRQAADLDHAQEAKLDLVCRKLRLQPGQRVLDIGCGWGEALKFAAERYGVQGVGITISVEQAEHARRLCAGLPVEIRLQDYHQLDEPFDAILSLGMFEHVGEKNYRDYFQVVRRCLRPQGLFLLHTIGTNVSRHRTDPWIARYIFPNSMLPSRRLPAPAKACSCSRTGTISAPTTTVPCRPGGATSRPLGHGWTHCAMTSASAACGTSTWPGRWPPSAAAAPSCGNWCCHRKECREATGHRAEALDCQ